MFLTALLLFLGGGVLGSFATALAHRVVRGENWISDRSRCPECDREIKAYDNIPIISWLALRGRCRNCQAPISPRYPLAELGLASLFTITYLVASAQDWECWQLVGGLVLCFFLVVVTLTDLDEKIIPNGVVLAGAIAGIAIVAVGDSGELPTRLIAAAIGGGFLFVVALVYPKGMGVGDAKLVGMMGLYLGKALAPGVLIGFLAGSLVGVAMIARGGAEARKNLIPFGPFLALGAIIALYLGDQIVDWYTDTYF